MVGSLVALLVVLVAPLGLFLWKLGLFRSTLVRIAFAVLVAGGLLVAAPLEGTDYSTLKKLNVLVAGAVVVLVGLRALGWWTNRRSYLVALGWNAVAAVVVYLNFFAFHGGHQWMHLHDVAHYYLGSRYAAELGYGDLYVAILRAEAEISGGVFWAAEARDLRTNRLEHVETIVRASRSDPVKARFSEQRWEDFRKDVHFFREAMGPRFAAVVQDHGYNPTPVWSLIGGSFSKRVPAGDAGGIFALTLLDPLLLLATLVLVGWAFGVEGALLAVVYFCIAFGAMFTWTGGSFLRHLWFAGAVGAVACRHRGANVVAGALLAVATGLRVFPIALAAGPLLGAMHDLFRERRVSADRLRFLGSCAIAGGVLLVATLVFEGGFARWADFRANAAVHGGSVSSNLIGITSWLAYLRGIDVGEPGGLESLVTWRDTAYRIQLLTLLLPAIVWLAIRSRTLAGVRAMALGTILVFVGLNLSAYYYTLLVVVVLAYLERPGLVLLVFAAELGVYVLHLFETLEVIVYLYKSLLVAWVLLAVVVEETREGRLSETKVRAG